MSGYATIILLLLTSFLLRLFLTPFGTLELDFNSFVGWSQRLVEVGPAQFYEAWSDYLPGYLYVLWGLGVLGNILPSLPQLLLYKLPAILADVATGALIFFAVSRFNKKLAIPAAALYLFNPAVFANSTLWGQIDGITVFLALSSIFFAKRLPFLSAVALGAGALVKPQAGFIAPIVAVLLWKTYGLKKTIGYAIFSLLIFLGGFVPFAHDVPFISFVMERLGATASQYPYSSINAFNFWALITGLWKPDGGGLQIGGIVVTVTILSLLLRYWWVRQERSKTIIWLVTALWFVVSFLFLTRMHERHLLPTLAPLAIAAAEFPLLLLPYAILSATYLANLRYSFVWIDEDFRQIFSPEVIVLFALLNMTMLGVMIAVFLRPKIGKINVFNQLKDYNWQLPAISRQLKFPSISFVEKYARRFLVVILGFALVSRLVGLWFPPTFYFDEVYHAFTAKEMLQGNNAAWEWWNTPPKGFAYEWTHPPLAKLGMVAGMFILGERPLGWRLPGALLGVGVVFLVYLLGVQLFKNKTVGLLAAAVFMLDGLPLVMSRIGMNDTYFLFFALLSIFLFLKERYFFSSVFLGLAAASK
ncbi:phospholipid carrier-dependent glycosyltransferase, partial [Candidatus Microgenomates bacterium]|nr:phospholipid carrier-dependent glycosyltransferase [Candidatus Microgenomates bacterium]